MKDLDKSLTYMSADKSTVSVFDTDTGRWEVYHKGRSSTGPTGYNAGGPYGPTGATGYPSVVYHRNYNYTGYTGGRHSTLPEYNEYKSRWQRFKNWWNTYSHLILVIGAVAIMLAALIIHSLKQG